MICSTSFVCQHYLTRDLIGHAKESICQCCFRRTKQSDNPSTSFRNPRELLASWHPADFHVSKMQTDLQYVRIFLLLFK